MSLVGSLEDLDLGDILQIINLSRKSGVLRLRSEEGEGLILLRDGAIHGAGLKGEPGDLGELLLQRRQLPQAQLDRLIERARESGTPLQDVVVANGLLGCDELEMLLREHVERLVLRMFLWGTGEFRFDVGASALAAEGDRGVHVAHGINPQFLALESSRLQDEGGPEEEIVGEAVLEDLGPDALEVQDEQAPPETASLPHPSPEPGEAPPASLLGASVVVIEPELPMLERIKRALSKVFARVHIFQRSELGVGRVRQYLARSENPIVLISEAAPPDPLTGARDWREIVTRLKSQSPSMQVFLLSASPPQSSGACAALDGTLAPPEESETEDWGELLRQRLRAGGSASARRGSAGEGAPCEARHAIEQACEQLRDASQEVDVLPLVLGCAARHFSRAAIFVVREERAVGLAQLGLERAGGPDDAGLHGLALPLRESAWFQQVLEARSPASGPPQDAGDRRLAEALGSQVPARAFVAPIERDGEVVAILYADNLPSDAPPGDTGPLETLLREAGLALERMPRAPAAGA